MPELRPSDYRLSVGRAFYSIFGVEQAHDSTTRLAPVYIQTTKDLRCAALRLFQQPQEQVSRLDTTVI